MHYLIWYKNSLIMRVIFRILSLPLMLVLGMGAVWLLFWFCNCLIWILSLQDILSSIFFEDAPAIWKIVGYMLSLQFIYPMAFLLILAKGLPVTSDDYKENWWYFLLLSVLLTIIVIIVYDLRCVSFLPEFLAGPVAFLQESWNFHLIGGVSWTDLDFSRKINDHLYFTVFDVMLGITCLAWNFFTFVGAWDDSLECNYD